MDWAGLFTGMAVAAVFFFSYLQPMLAQQGARPQPGARNLLDPAVSAPLAAAPPAPAGRKGKGKKGKAEAVPRGLGGPQDAREAAGSAQAEPADEVRPPIGSGSIGASTRGRTRAPRGGRPRARRVRPHCALLRRCLRTAHPRARPSSPRPRPRAQAAAAPPSEAALQEVLQGFLAKAEQHRTDMGDAQATVEHLVGSGFVGVCMGVCLWMGGAAAPRPAAARWARLRAPSPRRHLAPTLPCRQVLALAEDPRFGEVLGCTTGFQARLASQ